jgi:integrase
VQLDAAVQSTITDHLGRFGATDVELVDAVTPVPRRRTAQLLFTDAHGRPFHDRRWSEHWVRWRDAAGWPARHGTFHALRHFCATTMLTHGIDPQHVQKTLRHASLQRTLNTYVHWIPRRERPINIISQALQTASRKRAH